MSLVNYQKNTLMMSKLIEMKLLMDSKTLQDVNDLRVRVLHTLMYRNIHEMQRSMLEIMQEDEIVRCEETFRMEMKSEIERLHQVQQTSNQAQDEQAEPKQPSQKSDDISIHWDNDGTAICLLCNYTWNGI